MLDVERGMWPCATRIFLPRMPQIDTETMQGAFIKKHGLHRCARMGLFTDSLLLLRCLPLGFDAPPAQWIGTDFSQAEGALRSEKSVEICEICGRQLSAQCAKEQAECFYSPTDRALSTDTMRNAFIKKNTRPRGQRRRRCAKTIGLGLAPSAVGEAHRG